MAVSATPATNPQRWYDVPRLEGGSVLLRPLSTDDAAHWLDALGPAEDADAAWAHLTVAQPRTRRDVDQIITDHLQRQRQGQSVCWTQVDPRTGELAGLTTYYDLSPQTRSLAIGWTWLGRRFWASGINTDAKLLLLRRAFDDLGAARVVWHIDVLNGRSQRAVEKLGATRDGLLRKHRIRPDGTWRDTVQFAMTDDDWPAARVALENAVRRG